MSKARNCCTTTSTALVQLSALGSMADSSCLVRAGAQDTQRAHPTAVSSQLPWQTYDVRQQGRRVAEVTVEYMSLYFFYVNVSVHILPVRQTANVFARKIVQRRSRVISNAYVNQFLHKPTVKNVYVVFIPHWAEYG